MNALDLLKTLQEFSPLAVIALLSVIILMLVQSKRSVSQDVGDLRDNHVHEIVTALVRIETRLSGMNDHLIWIKSRLNGPLK